MGHPYRPVSGPHRVLSTRDCKLLRKRTSESRFYNSVESYIVNHVLSKLEKMSLGMLEKINIFFNEARMIESLDLTWGSSHYREVLTLDEDWRRNLDFFDLKLLLPQKKKMKTNLLQYAWHFLQNWEDLFLDYEDLNRIVHVSSVTSVPC